MINVRAMPFDDAAVLPEPRLPSTIELTPDQEAHEPPEARGLARDQVRLMVSYLSDNRVVHARFGDLPEFLQAGDVLIINTSGTLNAALPVTREDGTPLELHLSTHLPSDAWTVELRRYLEKGTAPFRGVKPGETFALPAKATATILAPYSDTTSRIWIAALQTSLPMKEYLGRYGYPIRYGYVPQSWGSEYYQTVYVTEMGSAEMPSAGRPFTTELITHLVARGIQFAPLVLHTGVASLEANEAPYAEFYRVPAETARVVNAARGEHRRIIAVGTTVVRALETVTDQEGVTWAGEGWTHVFVTPSRGVRSASALLTGLHEPRSTHLAMLEALAGREHLEITYAAARQEGYLWHEFGDVHLILP